MVLGAFARRRFLLDSESTNSYNGVTWGESNHDLDFVFERDGRAYGIEVKNTLGYLDFDEFLTKIRICHHIGVRPVFAVRALPRTWAGALIQSGGFAMIMRYQFYPWNQRDIAKEISEKLGLPVDAPRRIADGTMQRFENWVADPEGHPVDPQRGDIALRRIQAAIKRGSEQRAVLQPEAGDDVASDNGSNGENV
jgi:hypothetical protein